MLKDIDFEYPHKVEWLRIKADMMRLVEAEEEKFK